MKVFRIVVNSRITDTESVGRNALYKYEQRCAENPDGSVQLLAMRGEYVEVLAYRHGGREWIAQMA